MVCRTIALDTRVTINSLVDPDYFEAQAKAALQAQEQLGKMLDKLGPDLFPGIAEKQLHEQKPG
jgi:hypothetical protein